MTKQRAIILTLFLQIFTLTIFAQHEYFVNIDGVRGGAVMKDSLHNIIKKHNRIGYGCGGNRTWHAFYVTDAIEKEGKHNVIDRYSSNDYLFTEQGESVPGMHIEHSVAKSWWGGTKNDAYHDLHHLNPADAIANIRKNNYPPGELTYVKWENGVTFIGKAEIEGNLQNAYEPCDEYKGDFARIFMYMFTCYQDLTWTYTWMNYENSKYPTLKPWAVEMLMKWHKQDPVSTTEITRNNAVYMIQGNRNPFIDYPQLADYIWGDSINNTFRLPN